jgi:hypothetical protein
MASANKRKGSAAELAVAKWLRRKGWLNAERSRAGWQDDRGDIDGLPGVVIEVKNQKKMDIPGWLDELDVEMHNAKAWTGVLVVKRRGSTDPDDWYYIMTGKIWGDLMRAVEFGGKEEG